MRKQELIDCVKKHFANAKSIRSLGGKVIYNVQDYMYTLRVVADRFACISVGGRNIDLCKIEEQGEATMAEIITTLDGNEKFSKTHICDLLDKFGDSFFNDIRYSRRNVIDKITCFKRNNDLIVKSEEEIKIEELEKQISELKRLIIAKKHIQ